MRRDVTENPVLPPLLRIGDHPVSDLDRLEFEHELAEMVWGFVQTQESDPLPDGITTTSWATRRASGDFVAAAYGPRGERRVLVGDMTGRGLAAALATQPLLKAFHRDVGEVRSADNFICQLNQEVRRVLPRGYFSASVFLEVEANGTNFRLWNCGLPDVWLLPGTRSFQRFASAHPPLGVMNDSEMGRSMVEGVRNRGEPFVICTDGATSASALKNIRFGASALHRTLLDNRYVQDLAAAAVKEVLEFCWPKLPDDDITIVVVD